MNGNDIDSLVTVSNVLKSVSDRIDRIANGMTDEGAYLRLKTLVNRMRDDSHDTLEVARLYTLAYTNDWGKTLR